MKGVREDVIFVTGHRGSDDLSFSGKVSVL